MMQSSDAFINCIYRLCSLIGSAISPWNVLPADLLEASFLVEGDAPADCGEIHICMGGCRCSQELLHDCSAYSLTSTAYRKQ